MWTPHEDRLQFLSNDDVICRIRKAFLGQLNFTRNYFFIPNTSAGQVLLRYLFNTTVTFPEQLLLQSNYFFGVTTFSEHSFLLSDYSFKIVTYSEQ